MPIGFHPLDLIIIFVVALLIFGPKRLPEMGASIGKALTEFRRSMNELSSPQDDEQQQLRANTQHIVEHTRIDQEREQELARDQFASFTATAPSETYSVESLPVVPEAAPSSGAESTVETIATTPESHAYGEEHQSGTRQDV